MNKIFFSLLLLISISGNVNAQKKKDKNNSGIESESDAGAPADYKKARQIVLQAKELLKQGELEAADSLINESIRIYPTKEIFEYAKLLCELPDLSTANNIMDKAFDRVRLFEKPKIVLPEPVPSKFVDGKMISEMSEPADPVETPSAAYLTSFVMSQPVPVAEPPVEIFQKISCQPVARAPPAEFVVAVNVW